MNSELLSDLLRSAPVGIYVVDADFRLLMANTIAQRVFGSDDWVGRDFAELIHTLWPNPYADYLLGRFRHTLASGEPFEHPEHIGRRADRGAVEHYKWQIHRTQEMPGRYSVACYFRDITERVRAFRELERQREDLKTMLELVPVGVAIAHDSLGESITASPHLARMLGISTEQNASLSAADGPQQIFRAVRDGQVIPPHELPMQVAARSGVEQRDVEFDVEFADGRTLNMMMSAAPLFNPDGSVRGAIAAHVDVTALKRVHRELQAADRQKNEFMAMLAHELRNPLSPLRSAAEVLTRLPGLDVRLQNAAAVINRQVAVLSRLVDDLLDISRITKGQISLQLARVELAPLLTMALEAVQPIMLEKQHRLTTSMAAEPVVVEGDATRLLQCIVNLLTNAAKYSDTGGVIHLQLQRDDAAALIIIQDQGMGVAPEFLPRIFDLFAQGENTLGHSRGGLGVGLALVRRLILLHHGEVSCASEGIGRGARFEIRLPLAAPTVDAPGTI